MKKSVEALEMDLLKVKGTIRGEKERLEGVKRFLLRGGVNDTEDYEVNLALEGLDLSIKCLGKALEELKEV